MKRRPKKEHGAVQQLLNDEKRPTRGKGGRGRWGDIADFLIQEEVDVRKGREEERLTWDDIALAAARTGVTRPDGSPYPGPSFNRKWSALTKAGKIGGQEVTIRTAPGLAQLASKQEPEDKPPSQSVSTPLARETAASPSVSTPPASRSKPTPNTLPLPPGFDDLANPKALDPKKPNPREL